MVGVSTLQYTVQYCVVYSIGANQKQAKTKFRTIFTLKNRIIVRKWLKSYRLSILYAYCSRYKSLDMEMETQKKIKYENETKISKKKRRKKQLPLLFFIVTQLHHFHSIKSISISINTTHNFQNEQNNERNLLQ